MTTLLTLHGLGYIALPLEGAQRLHIWHPDLPRRANAAESAIHNHSFSYEGSVLRGAMRHRRFVIHANEEDGTHDLLDRNGGGATIIGRVDLAEVPGFEECAGRFYRVPLGEFHCSEPQGITVTLIKRMEESEAETNTLIQHGFDFDTAFDANQLDQDALWDVVRESLTGVGL